MASLWLDDTLPAGTLVELRLGGGVRHIGSSCAWNATRAMPERLTNNSYTLFDAAIRYDRGKAALAVQPAAAEQGVADSFTTASSDRLRAGKSPAAGSRHEFSCSSR